MVGARVREGLDLRPCFARIRAAPETVAAPGSQVKNVIVVGVNGQTLAHTAAGHVAADLEGQVNSLESAAVVLRAEDRAVLARPFIGVGSDREIDAIRIARVNGNALDAAEVPVGESNEVE